MNGNVKSINDEEYRLLILGFILMSCLVFGISMGIWILFFR